MIKVCAVCGSEDLTRRRVDGVLNIVCTFCGEIHYDAYDKRSNYIIERYWKNYYNEEDVYE